MLINSYTKVKIHKNTFNYKIVVKKQFNLCTLRLDATNFTVKNTKR